MIMAYISPWESHYNDDEYVVQLYSAHGAPVYDNYFYLMSRYQISVAYMVRGAGIPYLGIVDELTRFHGQIYKLCIRTKQYEFQLESKEFVDVDGTVDLAGASMYILDRRYEWQQCYDLDLLEYFMNIARAHTKSFCTWGRNWPEMRERKPEWFGEAE